MQADKKDNYLISESPHGSHIALCFCPEITSNKLIDCGMVLLSLPVPMLHNKSNNFQRGSIKYFDSDSSFTSGRKFQSMDYCSTRVRKEHKNSNAVCI